MNKIFNDGNGDLMMEYERVGVKEYDFGLLIFVSLDNVNNELIIKLGGRIDREVKISNGENLYNMDYERLGEFINILVYGFLENIID